jgi:hypothetical protein
MLKRPYAVLCSPAAGGFNWNLMLLPMVRWCRPAPVQTGIENVLGRDPPLPGLPGDRAWLLSGAREAPGAKIAADRRGRDPTCLSGLGNGQAWPLLGEVTTRTDQEPAPRCAYPEFVMICGPRVDGCGPTDRSTHQVDAADVAADLRSRSRVQSSGHDDGPDRLSVRLQNLVK